MWLRAFTLLIAARVVLRLLPFQTAQRLLVETRTPTNPGLSPERVFWAVQSAGRFVPGTRCLARALVGYRLLVQQGHDATLRVGVAKCNHNELDFHAWLEHSGRILIGGEKSQSYSQLLTIGADSRNPN